MRYIKRTLYLVTAIIITINTAAHAESPEYKFDKQVYTFGASFNSSGGRSSSQTMDMANILFGYVSQQAGVQIRIKTFSSTHDVTQAFLNNEVDSAMLFPTFSDDLIKVNKSLYPWGTYIVNKNRKAAYCLWEQKESMVATLEKIKGKELLCEDTSELYFIMLRKYLYENGIDMPLWELFESFTLAPSANSAFMALAMGDADFYWNKIDNREITKLISPAVAAKVNFTYCTEPVYARGTFVLNKNTVSEKDLEQFRVIMLNIIKNIDDYKKKDNDLKGVLEYLKLVKVRFIPAKADEFDVEFKLYEDSLKNGWADEAKRISTELEEAKKGTKVVIKNDYGYCRKFCENKENPVDCLKECMK